MRSTLRHLKTRLPFLLAALATLAVSIGTSTTMFTVVDTFLFAALPYEHADRLVMIWRTHRQASPPGEESEVPLSPGDFADLRAGAGSFERLAAIDSEYATVTGAGDPSRVHLLAVTGDFFRVLEVDPALGRTLGPEDEKPGAAPAVAVGYGYWQRELGGDPGVLGRTLEVGGSPYQVVGVLPADFHFSESLVATDPRFSKPVDVWAPLDMGTAAHERGFHVLTVVGRLKPGVGVGAADREARAYAEHAAAEYPETDAGYGLEVVSLREQVFGRLRPALLTLWAATGFVLLIACANLATLLMARGQAGHREVAVRLAIGASRARIVRESLLESVGLSLAGGALALGVAWAGVRLLAGLDPAGVFHAYPPAVDLRVFGFTFGVSLLAGLLFGGLPAFRASRIDAADGLREPSGSAPRGARLVFSLLVVSQIALATSLMIGTGLAVKSYVGLLRADLGFDLDRVLTLDLFLPLSRYRDTPRKLALFHDLLERTRKLPGVEAAGMNYALPLSGADPSNGFTIQGRPPLAEGEIQSANLGLVDPGYFRTLGIPLDKGRPLRETDTADAPPVAVVDERMVEQYFAGEDPLGRRISIGGDRSLTIVGVVGSVAQEALEPAARPYVYLPYQQRCYMFTSLVVRTRLDDPRRLAPAIRDVVRGLDRELPISNVSTLEAAYRRSIAPERFSLLLISVIAGVALFLTEVGTYGVMSFVGRQRRAEVGVRIALGAEPGQVFRLLVRQGLVLSLSGAVLGVAIALIGGRVLGNLVYGVGTFDLLVFSIVPAVTLVAAFAAYYLPARSLSGVDPRGILQAG